jgi:hypothetical protein
MRRPLAGWGRGTGDSVRPPSLAYAMVIGDIKRDLVSGSRPPDVDQQNDGPALDDAHAFG